MDTTRRLLGVRVRPWIRRAADLSLTYRYFLGQTCATSSCLPPCPLGQTCATSHMLGQLCTCMEEDSQVQLRCEDDQRREGGASVGPTTTCTPGGAPVGPTTTCTPGGAPVGCVSHRAPPDPRACPLIHALSPLVLLLTQPPQCHCTPACDLCHSCMRSTS